MIKTERSAFYVWNATIKGIHFAWNARVKDCVVIRLSCSGAKSRKWHCFGQCHLSRSVVLSAVAFSSSVLWFGFWFSAGIRTKMRVNNFYGRPHLSPCVNGRWPHVCSCDVINAEHSLIGANITCADDKCCLVVPQLHCTTCAAHFPNSLTPPFPARN